MDTDYILHKIYAKILKFLVVTPRTEAEVYKKLLTYKKGYEDLEEDTFIELVDSIMNMLRNEHFIDDSNYARNVLESLKISSKAQSPLKLKQLLHKKQLPNEYVNNIFSNVPESTKEAWAEKLAKSKVSSYAKLPYSIRRKKLAAFLYSKGFPIETINRAVDIALPVK